MEKGERESSGFVDKSSTRSLRRERRLRQVAFIVCFPARLARQNHGWKIHHRKVCQ